MSFLKKANTCQNITFYNVKRYNPITKTILSDEDTFLLNLDTESITLDIPAEILEKIMNLKSPEVFCFISQKENYLMKTKLPFLIYLILNNTRLDKISMRQVQRLVKQSQKLRKRNYIDYSLVLKCNHTTLFPRLIRDFQDSFPDRILRNEILEYWTFQPNRRTWSKIFINSKYAANKILTIVREWRIKLQAQKGKKDHNFLDYMQSQINQDNTLQIQNEREIVNLLADNEKEIISLGGEMDNILNSPDLISQDIEVDMAVMHDEILDLSGIVHNPPLAAFNLNDLQLIRPPLKEFLKFQEDTDNLRLTLLDVNRYSYDFYFEDENSTGEIVLMDVMKHYPLWIYTLGLRTLRNLYSIEGSNNFRVFLIEAQEQKILEITPHYLLKKISDESSTFDSATIDEINDINSQIMMILEDTKFPLTARLDVRIQLLELLVAGIEELILGKFQVENIIAGWGKDPENDDIYQQIYPPPEEQEEEQLNIDEEEESNDAEYEKDNKSEDNGEIEEAPEDSKDSSQNTNESSLPDNKA